MVSGRNRVLQALAALLGSAVLFYFGTGLTPVAALTWVAPIPVLLLAPRVSWPVATGVAFGAYLLGTANTWAFQLRSHDTPLWPVGIMIDFGMSVVFVLAVLAFRLQLRRGRPLLAAIAAPAVWTGALYVVSVSNPMGLGGTFANLQGDVPVVLQSAAVAGMWGVEFLVMLAPAAVAVLLAPDVRVAWRARAAVTGAVVLALALGAGALRLAMTDTGPTQRVAAVATNQRVWAPGLDTAAGKDLVAGYLDRIAALPDGVRTVVLPEQSFSSDEARPAALFDPMRQTAKSRDLDIVVGFAYQNGKAKYNYALLFPAGGGEPVTYLKHHDMVSPPGHDLVFSPTSGVRVGMEICLDINHADPTNDYAAAGADLLAIPASDETDNGWQHSRTALLRGVENGLPVVWSDRTGMPMITDGLGRVLADAHTGGPGAFTTVVADAPVGPGATPYTRFGDWFAWLCLAIALIPLLIRGSRRPTASGSPEAASYAPRPTVASHG
jgi:apolipoprotein N-acyltransferase